MSHWQFDDGNRHRMLQNDRLLPRTRVRSAHCCLTANSSACNCSFSCSSAAQSAALPNDIRGN